MKYIVLILLAMGLLAGCDPQDQGIDTGMSYGKHDCSMFDYFHKGTGDWDSTILMIERAGLVDLFEGKDSEMAQITFFGPTNHSIRRYMLNNGIQQVKDMSPAFCEKVILLHVVKGKKMKEEINFRIPDVSGTVVGATEMTTVGGVELLAYKEQEAWGNVANSGAIHLFLKSINAGNVNIPLASPDIETNSGVVHSLNYNYTLGELLTPDDFEKLVEDNQ